MVLSLALGGGSSCANRFQLENKNDIKSVAWPVAMIFDDLL
jgi:hypothetical protein